jgi:transposase
VEKDDRRSWSLPSRIGYRGAVDHLSDEAIERYALRELSESEIQQIEKHVSCCPECHDRLQDEVDLAAAMCPPSSAAMIREIIRAGRKKAAKG